MSDRDTARCQVCGEGKAADHPDCRRVEAEFAEHTRITYERLISEFKLRRVTAENRPGFQAAVRALSAHARRSEHVEYSGGIDVTRIEEGEALEAERWWFVPYCWMGCSGHIVDKATGHVTVLGSCHPLSLCFWAHERGALREPCTLVIERIRDVGHARTLLARLDNRSPFNPAPVRGREAAGNAGWIRPDDVLAKLPARIQSPSLWFALPALREAEECDAFAFRVE